MTVGGQEFFLPASTSQLSTVGYKVRCRPPWLLLDISSDQISRRVCHTSGAVSDHKTLRIADLNYASQRKPHPYVICYLCDRRLNSRNLVYQCFVLVYQSHESAFNKNHVN